MMYLTNLTWYIQNIVPNNCSIYIQAKHGKFIKIDHLHGCKTKLKFWRHLKILQNEFLNHSEIKLAANNKKVTWNPKS